MHFIRHVRPAIAAITSKVLEYTHKKIAVVIMVIGCQQSIITIKFQLISITLAALHAKRFGI